MNFALLKCLCGVAVPLALVPAHVPEQAQRPREPNGVLRLSAPEQPSHRGTQVAVLGFEAPEPSHLLVTLQLWRGQFRELQEKLRVTPAQRGILSGLLELLGGVLPERFEEAVAGLPFVLHDQDERLVHQRGQRIQDPAPLEGVTGAYRFGGPERPTAREG